MIDATCVDAESAVGFPGVYSCGNIAHDWCFGLHKNNAPLNLPLKSYFCGGVGNAGWQGFLKACKLNPP